MLDGSTGHVLWSLNTSIVENSSDLKLKTTEKNRDAFVFRMKGRTDHKAGGILTHGLLLQTGEMVNNDTCYLNVRT